MGFFTHVWDNKPKLMRRVYQYNHVKVLLLAVSFVVLSTGTALATNSQSPSFELEEPQFGAGSALETCSGQYCAQASIGDMGSGLGDSSSASFSSGPEVGDEPLLEVIVEPGASHLGVLSTNTTSHKMTTLKIRTYLSDGYIVQITGDPPRYEDHALHAPSSPTASVPGTEQFALNLVANTTPQVGVNPLQTPSGEISFGYVLPNYNAPNMFMYQSGDIVARSDSESGQTDYTISMIVNVAGSTPAGHFSGDYAVVVTPRF